jgi:hypothetical protein
MLDGRRSDRHSCEAELAGDGDHAAALGDTPRTTHRASPGHHEVTTPADPEVRFLGELPLLALTEQAREAAR